MQDERIIFRKSALDRYINGKEKDVLPRLVAPRVFMTMWIVLALLAMAIIALLNARVSTYIQGTVFVGTIPQSEIACNPVCFVMLFDSQEMPDIHVGNFLEVRLGRSGPIVKQKIEMIDQMSVESIATLARYGIPTNTISIDRPSSAIAITSQVADLPPDIQNGSTLSVEIATGSRSIFSLLAGSTN